MLSVKKFFRKIHLHTLLVLVVYFSVSKIVFVHSLLNKNLFNSFLFPFVFGVIASFVFFFLFNHDDFFHFIKEIENAEKKKEKKYVRSFKHWGKVATAVIAGTVGGPILSALSVRLLLRRNKFRFVFLILNSVLSTVWTTSVLKGGYNLLF